MSLVFRPEHANLRSIDMAKSLKKPPKKIPNKKANPRAQANVQEILKLLFEEFPDAECALNHRNAFELLVATILSAQCTDERVNKVTPALFVAFPTPEKMANANVEEIEKLVQSTGFFKNKARNIKACSQLLCERHKGQVPNQLDQLVDLPGVGRKTANVVLGVWFKIASGVVVDTHVGRISQLLGLTRNEDPVKIEQDLMTLVPKSEWIAFSHLLILHGRKTCKARSPNCEDCNLQDLCPGAQI